MSKLSASTILMLCSALLASVAVQACRPRVAGRAARTLADDSARIERSLARNTRDDITTGEPQHDQVLEALRDAIELISSTASPSPPTPLSGSDHETSRLANMIDGSDLAISSYFRFVRSDFAWEYQAIEQVIASLGADATEKDVWNAAHLAHGFVGEYRAMFSSDEGISILMLWILESLVDQRQHNVRLCAEDPIVSPLFDATAYYTPQNLGREIDLTRAFFSAPLLSEPEYLSDEQMANAQSRIGDVASEAMPDFWTFIELSGTEAVGYERTICDAYVLFYQTAVELPDFPLAPWMRTLARDDLRYFGIIP